MERRDNDKTGDLHRRWTERLAKWLRRPAEEGTREEPTTAASATMRENLSEPRE
jgi:hypothetical protein